MILPFMNNAVDIGDTTGVTGSSFENKDVLSFFNRANFKHRMFEEMKKKKVTQYYLEKGFQCKKLCQIPNDQLVHTNLTKIVLHQT